MLAFRNFKLKVCIVGDMEGQNRRPSRSLHKIFGRAVSLAVSGLGGFKLVESGDSESYSSSN